MANLKKPLVASISILAVVAGAFYGALLLMREDPEQAKATQKAVRKEFRAAPMDEMAKRLRRLTDERSVSDSLALKEVYRAIVVAYQEVAVKAPFAQGVLLGFGQFPRADEVLREFDKLPCATVCVGLSTAAKLRAHTACAFSASMGKELLISLGTTP